MLKRIAGAVLLCGAMAWTAQAQTDAQAQKIFDLTNQDRAAHGLPTLQWNTALAAAAQAHAEKMAQQKSLSHQYAGEPDPATRAAQAGAHFEAIAENIAMGWRPEDIEKQWMKSVPHRTNILDPKMNAIGVGVADRGGYLYAVEDFTNASQALTPEQVEQKVSALLQDQNIDPSGPHQAAEEACTTNNGVPKGQQGGAVIRFETPDLSQLPEQVANQIKSGNYTKAAVATCKPEGGQKNFTIYRVAIILY